MMRKRLVLALVFLLAACSGPDRPRASSTIAAPLPVGRTATALPTPVDRTTITFACSDATLGRYRGLAEAFQEERPDIQVQVVASDAVYGDEEDGLQELVASVDSFALSRELTAQDVQSGLLRDLQPFVEADATFEPEDIYPGLLDRYRWQGELWGLPAPGTLPLLFYDKAAFEEASLPLPRPGWRFEEFETAVQALTERQGDKVSRYGLVVSPRGLAGPILVLGRARGWAEGAAVVPEPILDTPAVVEAAEWFVGLIQEGVVPNPYELEKGTALLVAREVEEGRAAMWDGWPIASLLGIYEAVYDLGVAPFPEGTAVGEWVSNTPYLMSGGTTHPEEVWQWLRFLTYQPGDVDGVRPPVRRSVAEGSGYWEGLGEELSSVVRYVMERDKVALPPGAVPALREALQVALEEDRAAEEVLAQARQALAEALGMPVSQATPPPVPTPVHSQAKTSITYCPNAPSAIESYKRLADAFQQNHPEVTVSIVRDQVSFEDFAESCDCFNYSLHSDLQRPERRELVLNLQPLVDFDPNFPDDFYPGLLDALRWEGDLWAVPAYVDLRVIRYNKDLFDQAGVPYPQPGWTPDDFWEKAVALTSGEGEDKVFGYMPNFPGDELDDLNFFVEQFGGFGEYDEIEAATASTPLQSSHAVAAMHWYTNLMLKDAVMPHFPDEEEDKIAAWRERIALINAGRVAMWTQTMNTDWTAPAFPVGTAPLPLEQGPMRQYVIVGHMISDKTAHPDACWAWIEFLLDHPTAAVVGAPPRASVLEKQASVEQADEDMMVTISFSLEHLGSIPKRQNYWLYLAFQDVMEGSSVEAAMEQALLRDGTFRACLKRVPDSLQEEDIRACSEEARSSTP